ncbi:MAG: hypothetical protein ACJA1A_001167 [Saprospiraceae bacterium]|jgi:hypothetical protein
MCSILHVQTVEIWDVNENQPKDWRPEPIEYQFVYNSMFPAKMLLFSLMN